MDVAVLGGTFAPPTMAHYALLREGMRFTGAQAGVWVPSSVSYMRKWRPESMPEKWFIDDGRRADMIGALCAAEPDMRAYLDEMRKPEGAYTYDTLCALEALYGGKVWFLMGSDLVPSFPDWYRARELAERFGIVVASRGEDGAQAVARAGIKGARVMPFPDVYRDASATRARELIRSGRLCDAEELLHPAVYSYIQKQYTSPVVT